jgi:hypothetical protein
VFWVFRIFERVWFFLRGEGFFECSLGFCGFFWVLFWFVRSFYSLGVSKMSSQKGGTCGIDACVHGVFYVMPSFSVLGFLYCLHFVLHHMYICCCCFGSELWFVRHGWLLN